MRFWKCGFCGFDSFEEKLLVKLVSGQVLTEKRNRLDPDLLADLVFCGENLDFVRDRVETDGVVAAAAACTAMQQQQQLQQFLKFIL